ncbi:MAG: C40 family peptidase [Candidatus Limivicinus sp.]|jgi:cell wall-associated NlpC family hydrolase
MRKPLLIAAAAASLFFCVNSCSGHRAENLIPADEEPGPFESLLMYSEWSDGDGHELKFEKGFSGELDGRSFSWTEGDDELHLSFAPGAAAASDEVLKAEEEGGVITLSAGDESFRQRIFLPPSTGPAAMRARDEADEKEALHRLGQQIAGCAMSYEGCKYKYGGKSPKTGFDCSGLVCYVYDKFGYNLNRIAKDQALQGVHVEPEELQPGDVLCFYTSKKYIGHVGIFLGNGYYVHAMGSAYGVQITALDDPYLTRKYEARRMVGCPELLKDAPAPAAAN